MDIKRWLILVSSLVFLFAIYQAADAKSLDLVEINFDKGTLDRGFPVYSQDRNFFVPIYPKQFSELKVKLSLENCDALLAGKQFVSSCYLLDMKPGYSGFLKKPSWLTFNVDELSGDEVVYFYDNHYQAWRPLKTSIDFNRGRVQAWTIFPYAKYVVLENSNILPQTPNDLTAASAMVVDKQTGDVVFTKNSHEIRSIASLTKLMTTLVFVENNPGWDKLITIEKDDFVGGATLWVKEGDQVTVKDLFYSTLVGSKNNAAVALAKSTGMSVAQFVAKMNQKATELGLTNTYFAEPTGLNERNVSTAEEMAVIAREAFKNPDIVAASTTKWYKVVPTNSGLVYWVKNTSMKVLERDLYVTGSKTGWTDEAGYCLVTQAKKGDKELLALVMGAAITRNYEEVYGLLKNNL